MALRFGGLLGQKRSLEQFWARQASGRGGLMQVSQVGERVHLWGQAVITMRGSLDRHKKPA